jgi:hypothetical protein
VIGLIRGSTIVSCLPPPQTDIRCAMEPNPYICMLFQQGTCSLRLIAVLEAPECLLSVQREPAEVANLVLRTQKFILPLRRFQSYRACTVEFILRYEASTAVHGSTAVPCF